MTDLPPGWEWATLEDLTASDARSITDGPFGSNLKSEHYRGAGARVFRLQNIGDGLFRDVKTYIEIDHFRRLQAHEAREGDLLIASLGEDPPRACLVPPLHEYAIVKADCIRIRLSEHIVPRWVLYALLAPGTKSYAANLIKGVGRPRLGLSQIRKIPIPLPPRAEQERIVAALEDHLSRLDAGRSTLQSIERRTRSSFTASLSSMIKNLSLEPWMRLGDLSIDQRYGTSVKCFYDGPGIPVLRIPNVQSGQIDLLDLKYASVDSDEFVRLRLRQGDVLFVRTNGSKNLIGRSAVVSRDIDHAFASYLIRFRFDTSIVQPKWIQLALESPQLRTRIEEVAASSAGQYNLGISKLANLEIPLPSIATQSALVDQFSELKVKLGRLSAEVSAAQLRTDRLRRALLTEAFAGRLVLQDPNEESASVLLERISSERVAQPKRIRRTKNPTQEALL